MVGDDSVRRLSPDTRREDIVGPITTIPYDAIEPFLRKPRILTDDDLDALPYVVANQEQRTLAGPGDRSYRARPGGCAGRPGSRHRPSDLPVRGPQRNGDERARCAATAFALEKVRYRTASARPDASGNPLSANSIVSTIRSSAMNCGNRRGPRVILVGDPILVELIEGRREVMTGDYVLPVEYDDTNLASSGPWTTYPNTPGPDHQ
jgi:hypothetical protein